MGDILQIIFSFSIDLYEFFLFFVILSIQNITSLEKKNQIRYGVIIHTSVKDASFIVCSYLFSNLRASLKSNNVNTI